MKARREAGQSVCHRYQIHTCAESVAGRRREAWWWRRWAVAATTRRRVPAGRTSYRNVYLADLRAAVERNSLQLLQGGGGASGAQ